MRLPWWLRPNHGTTRSPILLAKMQSYYEQRGSWLCAIFGGHDWMHSGGIPFNGKEGIWTNGYQHFSCFHCRAEKWYWPWGDWMPDVDETFGYNKKACIPKQNLL